MENLLLFCCRACLKGDGDDAYYQTLGIDKKANLDAVKKAYKVRSLQLHPDRLANKGIQVTHEHNVEFHKLKEAYDVLSDPRKRRIYDQLGPSGLALLESPEKLNPKELIKNFQKNRSDRAKIGITVLFIFAAILILPILFSLKCDGRIDGAPWLAIWTPMWVVDAVLIIASVLFFLEPDPQREDGEEDEERREHEEKIPISAKIFFFCHNAAFVLLQIFILAKLDEEVEWSWGKVFIPWFIYEGLNIAEKLPTVLSTIPPPDYSAIVSDAEDNSPEAVKVQRAMISNEHFHKLVEQLAMRKSVAIALLRVWLAIFLAIQLDQDVDWNWGLVLLPIWIYFLNEYLNVYWMRSWASTLMDGISLEQLEAGIEDPELVLKAQQGQELLAASTVSVCLTIFPVIMSILLVCRLETDNYSTFIILIPVFLVIGCCLCGVCCTLFVLANMDTDAMDASNGSDDSAKNMVQKEEYVPPNPKDVEQHSNSSDQGNAGQVYGTFSADHAADAPNISPPIDTKSVEVDID